jgi:CheY-like chemotaxis protein
MTEDTRILFIDDDLAMRPLVSNLSAATGLSLELRQPQEVEAINAALNHPDLRLVLLDRLLQDGGSLLPVLEDILEGQVRDPPVPTFILSGADFDPVSREAEINDWRAAVGAFLDIRGTLQKPLSTLTLAGVVAGFRRNEDSCGLSPGLGAPLDAIEHFVQNLDLPARLLGAAGALHCNVHWSWDQNFPELNDDRDFFLPSPEVGEPRWLTAYRLSSTTTLDNRRIQIAVSLGPYTTEKTTHDYLNSMWLVLQRMGFSRMRYYRKWEVPDTHGVLSLEWAAGKPALSRVSFPGYENWSPTNGQVGHLSFPADSFVDARFDHKSGKRPDQFVYRIQARNDEAGAEKSPAIAYVNEVTGLSPDDQWFECPVLWRVEHDGRPKYETCALIIADKVGQAVGQITHAEIERKAVSLRNHCIELAENLERQTAARERDARVGARTFFITHSSQLDQRNAFESFIHAITEKAREVSGAEVSTMAWMPRNSADPLILAAAVAPGSETAFPNAKLFENKPMPKTVYPLLGKVFSTKLPVYWQDGVPDDIVELRNQSGKSRDDWPRIAIPFRVGDRVVGAIGLVHRSKRYFTRERIDAVNYLAELCAFILDYLGAEESHHEWEIALMHEVRSSGTRALKALSSTGSTPEVDRKAKARWFLAMLLDRSSSYMRLNQSQGARRKEAVHPAICLKREVELAKIVAKDHEKVIESSLLSGSFPAVDAEPECLPFVIRTLLDNAMHHGTGATINVVEQISAGKWILRVVNFGLMTEADNENKFRPFVIVPNRRQDGSHMALAAARNWVMAHGATLTVENEREGQSDIVVATVKWPIAREGN